MATIYQRNLLVALAAALVWTMAGPQLIAPARRALERGVALSIPLPGDLRAVVRIGTSPGDVFDPAPVPESCAVDLPAHRRQP